MLERDVEQQPDVRIVERVLDVPSLLTVADKPARAQQAQAVRAGGLREPGRGARSQMRSSPASSRLRIRRTRSGSARSGLSLFGTGAWAYSPDRTRLPLAGPCQIGNGLSAGITFVDVAGLRTVGCLWLGGIAAMTWPEPRRLIVVASEVDSIDPVRGRVLGRSPLPLGQQLVAVARAADRLVLLVASGGFGRLWVPETKIACCRLALRAAGGPRFVLRL